uniref:Membrane protein BRI3 n=1 Tax=Ditylenchus dipsaci TaxID=166011 RepID=A0A915DXX8_9BILA
MVTMDKPTSVQEVASAPPSEVDHNGGQGLADTRRVEQAAHVLQPPPSYNPQSLQSSSSESPSSQAPPPYQEAVNYPSYQPSTVPKPLSNVQQIYPPAAYPTYPHYNATGGAAPASYIIQTAAPTPPTVTSGRVEPETDLCCLLCLIVLAIFTFPFGLVLLCCIPCTTRRRCLHCRRLNG